MGFKLVTSAVPQCSALPTGCPWNGRLRAGHIMSNTQCGSRTVWLKMWTVGKRPWLGHNNLVASTIWLDQAILNHDTCTICACNSFKQGFWYFALSRSCEFQVNPRNPAKFTKTRKIPRNSLEILPNTCRHNIFESYLGCWGCELAVNLLIYLKTSSPQHVTTENYQAFLD